MYCKYCGKYISDDAIFCSYCGKEQTLDSTKNSTSDNSDGLTTIPASTMEMKQDSAAKPDVTNTSAKSHKHVMKWLIPLFLIFIAVGIVVYSVVSENNKQNDFTVGVSSNDFSFTYDDSDGITVKTTVIPKYDFVDFTYTITYYGSGLLNDVEEDVVVGDVSAGTVLTYSKPLSEIESKISGAYSYTSVRCKSGKKQYKNKGDLIETEYNKELDFVFTLKYYSGSDDYTLSCVITNKTDSYIKEVRTLRISLDFGNDISCTFYTPRIIFDRELAPNEQITLTNLSGNRGIGLGTGDIAGKKEMLKTGLDSISYSNQTYQVIYT